MASGPDSAHDRLGDEILAVIAALNLRTGGLINAQAGVSPDMAIRLAKAFGATPWLRMQAAYDLAQARLHEDEIKVERYQPSHSD